MSWKAKLEEVQDYIKDLEEEIAELKSEGGSAEDVKKLEEQIETEREAAKLLQESNTEEIADLKAQLEKAGSGSEGASDDFKKEFNDLIRSKVNTTMGSLKKLYSNTDDKDVKAEIKKISNETVKGFKEALSWLDSQ